MYVQSLNGVTAVEYTDAQLRADNPNVSFPSTLKDTIRASYSMYPATETAQPAHDPAYQTVTYDFTGSGSTWTQNWSVVGNGVSDEALRETRYDDNAAYADTLIAAARQTPETGVTLTEREASRAENRRNNRGRMNDQTRVSDAEDYLLDYIDTVYDALDQADDTVENLDRAGLEQWVPTSATWPTWVPYAP